MAETATPASAADAGQGGYILATALPGLNYLPVRWLVVELLLVLAQAGKEYAVLETCRQLSDRLGRTRFFKNGVVALASAKVPRWLQISQSAAAAFATSVGAAGGMGGMLVFWGEWLWSLLPGEINIYSSGSPRRSGGGGGISDRPLVPDNSAREALSAELGGNGDRWFEAMVLGLAVASPRVAAILEAIAALAPTPATGPTASLVPEVDVIGESPSIWR